MLVCCDAQLTSELGQNLNPSLAIVCLLPPAADMVGTARAALALAPATALATTAHMKPFDIEAALAWMRSCGCSRAALIRTHKPRLVPPRVD